MQDLKAELENAKEMIRRLESQIRIIKYVTATVVVLVVLGSLYSFELGRKNYTAANDVLEAQEFIVRDAMGRKRAVFGSDLDRIGRRSFGFHFYDENGERKGEWTIYDPYKPDGRANTQNAEAKKDD
jgi:hypothetical protein